MPWKSAAPVAVVSSVLYLWLARNSLGFVVDAAEGVSSADQAITDLLRRSQRPVLLVGNPTGGSRITYSLGTAVFRAAVDARTQLRQRAASLLRCPPDEVEYRNGEFWSASDPAHRLTLAQVARGSSSAGDGPVVGTGEVTHLLRAPAFATQLVEVEVDPETGAVIVVNAVAAQDVGKAINPTALRP